MTLEEIRKNAPISDEDLHYWEISIGRVFYFMPTKPYGKYDLVWNEIERIWVKWDSVEYCGRIENNKNIKPLYSWTLEPLK